MPKVIIINIPMMYHCFLHVQSMLLMSAASTAFILCIAIFVTQAFNLDCPCIMYIIINIIISVISMAVNISTSARKLFRNDLNFEFPFCLFNSCSFLLRIFFLFLYWIAKSCSVFGVMIKLGLISNVSSDRGKICSCFVCFQEIGMPNSSIMSSK